MEEGNTEVTEPTEAQPLQEQPTEEVVETPDVPDEIVEPTEDAPVAAEAQAEVEITEEEEDQVPHIPQVPNPEAVDINQFVDQDGQLDLAAYQQAQANNQQAVIQAAVAQATAQMNATREYEKTWDKAYEKYPELRKNSDLRNMVKAIHADSANPGQAYLSPAKAAEKLFKQFGDVRADATAKATTTRTVQAAAQLAVSNPPSQVQADRASTLRDQMKTGSTLEERKQGTLGYLEELAKSGLI